MFILSLCHVSKTGIYFVYFIGPLHETGSIKMKILTIFALSLLFLPGPADGQTYLDSTAAIFDMSKSYLTHRAHGPKPAHQGCR